MDGVGSFMTLLIPIELFVSGSRGAPRFERELPFVRLSSQLFFFRWKDTHWRTRVKDEVGDDRLMYDVEIKLMANGNNAR